MDVGGALGTYNIQAYLNSYVKQGTSNLSIGSKVAEFEAGTKQ